MILRTNDDARFLFSACRNRRRRPRFGRTTDIGVEIETIFSREHDQFQTEVQDRPDDQTRPHPTIERTVAGYFRHTHRPDIVIVVRQFAVGSPYDEPFDEPYDRLTIRPTDRMTDRLGDRRFAAMSDAIATNPT